MGRIRALPSTRLRGALRGPTIVGQTRDMNEPVDFSNAQQGPQELHAPILAVDLDDASRMTSLSPNTLSRLARGGRLRSTLIGRRRIFPLAALWELVEKGSPGAVR